MSAPPPRARDLSDAGAPPLPPRSCARLADRVAPAQHPPLDDADERVRHSTEDRERDDGDEHEVDARRLLRVSEAEAETARASEELRDDDEQPGLRRAEAQTREQVRQRGRQNDAACDLPSPQIEDASDLDELSIDAGDSRDEVHVDGEERADRDERDLGRLVDAEPEQEERRPRKRRDGAQRLQRRLERPLRALRQARDQTEGDRDERAERESLDDAHGRREQVLLQETAAPEANRRVEHDRRRWELIGLEDPE